MNNFDYMGFSYDGFGPDAMFVVNAKKFSKEDVLTLCKIEYEHLFNPKFGGMYKEPTLNNLKKNGAHIEWEFQKIGQWEVIL